MAGQQNAQPVLTELFPCCLLLLRALKLLPIQLLDKTTQPRKNIFDISRTQVKYIETDVLQACAVS